MGSAVHTQFNREKWHSKTSIIDEYRCQLEQRLLELAPEENDKPLVLSRSVRYNLLSAGKRVRGMLTVLCARCFDGNLDAAQEVACSIEMIHAASLALDDLPTMDNAKLRRGSASSHTVFGEDTTILCAVTILNNAYQNVARSQVISDEQKVALVILMTEAVGQMGLTGGQHLDLHPEPGMDPIEDVELVHRRKTGALFGAATGAGAVVSGQSKAAQQLLHEAGILLGMAFQIYDDLIDVLGCSKTEGKLLGVDQKKQTMVSAIGAGPAESRADAHIEAALAMLAELGGHQAELLSYLQLLRDHFKQIISPNNSAAVRSLP